MHIHEKFLSISFFVLLPFCFVPAAIGQHNSKSGQPNIILILSDDAGYADFGFQSDRLIPTPNIDRIANEGVKFTNAYVTAAVCSPSRGGLLTGINQAEFGNVGNYIKGVKYNIPQDSFGIPQHVKLVGDYLHPLQYKTGIIGKWHEGFSTQFHPNQRGFDYFWGFLWGSSPYFSGRANEVQENGKPVLPKNIEYMTDAIAAKAIDFINQQKDNPFFLFVSFNAVHAPLQAKPEDIERFKNRFSDSIRLKNAAMTYSLDENVGKIFTRLEELKMMDNTIIIFANDNGGQKVVLHADNYPLRGMKSDPYEGGIRVPMAMRWKGKIKPGTVSNSIVSTLDFIPTMLDAAGGSAKSNPQLKGIDLVDMVGSPVLSKKYEERTLFWKLGKDKGAIRSGNWKMVFQLDKTPELYNLQQDIGETKDVYVIEKAKGDELLKQYQQWLKGLPPERYLSLTPGEE